MLRRLAASLVTIWACVTLTFFAFAVLPSDPARTLAGPQARAADVAKLRAQLGLDRPVHERYARFLASLVAPALGATPPTAVDLGPVRLDLGTSYLKRRPVTTLLGEALGSTLLLGALALLVQLALGVAAGTFAAVRRGTAFDQLVVALTLIGGSAPTFVTGLLLQLLLARELRWFPLGADLRDVSSTLQSAVLPALTLGLFGAAFTTRIVRDELSRVLAQPHVRTATAKGLSGGTVLLRHGLYNTLPTLVTLVALEAGSLVGGAIVTEKLFRWPGIGALTVDAITERDGPVVLGVVVLLATTVVSANLVADLLVRRLDPRARSAQTT